MAWSGYPIISSLLFLSGCPLAKPDEQVVDRIEARLAADPCLANLKQLRRVYSYAVRSAKIDPNKIAVVISLSQPDGPPAGRIITGPPTSSILDGRDQFGASATYVVDKDALDLWHCGEARYGRRHDPLY
ncbi:hypothetical protein [Sphingomonas prati]|uniref:hypothetical protein n=1 Tax=Sphingomonas prati TaxID=1843237 RepID=UPI00166C5813|nr:hypothetical protein [Sphingomonas prati]GGE83163.1 hypothetical protein GCM10011404_14850 [Sphingomonas prati]